MLQENSILADYAKLMKNKTERVSYYSNLKQYQCAVTIYISVVHLLWLFGLNKPFETLISIHVMGYC